jgi:hypothetical protein
MTEQPARYLSPLDLARAKGQPPVQPSPGGGIGGRAPLDERLLSAERSDRRAGFPPAELVADFDPELAELIAASLAASAEATTAVNWWTSAEVGGPRWRSAVHDEIAAAARGEGSPELITRLIQGQGADLAEACAAIGAAPVIASVPTPVGIASQTPAPTDWQHLTGVVVAFASAGLTVAVRLDGVELVMRRGGEAHRQRTEPPGRTRRRHPAPTPRQVPGHDLPG